MKQPAEAIVDVWKRWFTANRILLWRIKSVIVDLFDFHDLSVKWILHLQNCDTAIHLAAANNHSGSLRLLLSSYSNSSLKNAQGETPLHLAVRFGHVTCSRVLISSNCDVNLQNMVCLIIAVCSGAGMFVPVRRMLLHTQSGRYLTYRSHVCLMFRWEIHLYILQQSHNITN